MHEVKVWRRENKKEDDGKPPKEVCMVGWTPQFHSMFFLIPERHLTPTEVQERQGQERSLAVTLASLSLQNQL